MLWSSIKFSLLYYNSLRKCMEINQENLYVDVRAKKIKEHWQLTRNMRSFGKTQQLVGKSTVGLWQENFRQKTSEIPGTLLPFSEVLTYCNVYICTDCFRPIWPSQRHKQMKSAKCYVEIFTIIFSAKNWQEKWIFHLDLKITFWW